LECAIPGAVGGRRLWSGGVLGQEGAAQRQGTVGILGFFALGAKRGGMRSGADDRLQRLAPSS